MNQTQALAKAKKVLGPKAIVQVNSRVPVGEKRAAEIQLRSVLTTELKALVEARDARRNELLKNDAEFQRLKQEAIDKEKARDNCHAGYHHRVEIGVNGGFFTSIRAGGDNFDEALANLTSRNLTVAR